MGDLTGQSHCQTPEHHTEPCSSRHHQLRTCGCSRLLECIIHQHGRAAHVSWSVLVLLLSTCCAGCQQQCAFSLVVMLAACTLHAAEYEVASFQQTADSDPFVSSLLFLLYPAGMRMVGGGTCGTRTARATVAKWQWTSATSGCGSDWQQPTSQQSYWRTMQSSRVLPLGRTC